ncbi:ABC transporter ATP-binding protein [Paenibacillus chartarius]|uniref:ABC transporter ATP-binding protein n=1 Tax=Paenibacillus chartarius TaxID=747481 RepID=A0ABV6DG94_9BACL
MSPLSMNAITKHFGEKAAVDGITLEVKGGEIYGLLGANGAGKTTTMRMALGLIYPDQGTIRWHGRGYSEELRRVLGYLPEERGLYPKLMVSEQILYFAELRGMSKRDSVTALKGWLDKFDIPDYYNKRVEELSKGNQQKIQFIAAVIHDPSILILDEAFSGLDPVNAELLKETVVELRDAGKAILFSSHRMEHVEELCENICMMKAGRAVLQGSLTEMKRAFPRERLILETEHDVQGIERLPGVVQVNRRANGMEIRINRTDTAQAVLRLAAEQTAVYRFQLMEPTLHEMFIAKVGGEASHV